MNKDYRLPENRHEYFTALYATSLLHGILPGLVYLYMPSLSMSEQWTPEQDLWFAAINGHTQNPITSLRIFRQLPDPLAGDAEWNKFNTWFNDNWATLQFDTDRVKNKRNTVKGLWDYAQLAREHGSGVAMYAGKTYDECWSVASSIHSFGRLSTFSYLEYVHLLGHGPDCTDLMFGDKNGSKSHRNGMLFLQGQDHMVWDKRQPNSFDGNYDFKKMVPWLDAKAHEFLEGFKDQYPNLDDAGNFTFESALCQLKNGFFGRRFPGVYSWMAWERIKWYDERGLSECTKVFKDMRLESLPDWLLPEVNGEKRSIKQLSNIFVETGVPYNAQYFLTDN
jgi:hypothetical protein